MAGKEQTASRERTIVKTAVVGIVTNILLASFKALVGFASHSTALVLDAVNNTSEFVFPLFPVASLLRPIRRARQDAAPPEALPSGA